MSTLLEALQILVDNGLSNDYVKTVCNDLLEADALDDDDDKKAIVLYAVCEDWEGGGDLDIEVSKYDDCMFTVGKRDYLVLDEDERESRWDYCLESCLDDGCVDGADSPYFDREAWKRDARMDGAGHTLNPYDGNEHEYSVGKEWYYVYRTN
jgi:hypothetical protein